MTRQHESTCPKYLGTVSVTTNRGCRRVYRVLTRDASSNMAGHEPIAMADLVDDGRSMSMLFSLEGRWRGAGQNLPSSNGCLGNYYTAKKNPTSTMDSESRRLAKGRGQLTANLV